ncbi:hypothetical protein [Streptomyces sp. NPDC017095]|uniref:hypothetical protein n=1 Tax=Streptomyces sp. NPDC017095 TaxID=3364977 RepID=UPI00378A9533
MSTRQQRGLAVRLLHIPPTVPATMRAALMRGQKSVEELVDLYPIRNQAVRGVLIDYFTRRRADSDYAALKNQVLHLVHTSGRRSNASMPIRAIC